MKFHRTPTHAAVQPYHQINTSTVEWTKKCRLPRAIRLTSWDVSALTCKDLTLRASGWVWAIGAAGRRVSVCPPPPADLSMALCDHCEPHWQGWPRLLIRPHNPGARRLNLWTLSQWRIAASRGHVERTGHYWASFKVLLAVTARLSVVLSLEPAERFYWYFKYLKETGT